MSDLIPMKKAMELPLAKQVGLTEHQLRRWRDNGLLPVRETHNGPIRSRYFVDPAMVESLIQQFMIVKTIYKPWKRAKKKVAKLA
jgi:hypothetical protein